MAQLLDQLEHLSGTLRHIVARVILYDNLNAVLACGADHPFGFGVDISALRQGRRPCFSSPSTDWMHIMAKPFAMAAAVTRIRELIAL